MRFIKKIINSVILLSLLHFVPTIVFAGFIGCSPELGNGSWELVDTQSPQAWDGVFVDEVTFGNNRYSVDWCGWQNNKSKECAVNCRGSANSFGTTFSGGDGWSPCQPESARIYRYTCKDATPCINCNFSKKCPD